MKIFKLAFVLASSSLASFLSPILKNQHTKLPANEQRLLLVPFQDFLIDLHDSNLKFLSGHPLDAVQIIESRVKPVSSDTIKIEFYISLDDQNYEITANFDLNSQIITDFSVNNGQSHMTREIQKISHIDLLMNDQILHPKYQNYIQEFGLSDLAQVLDGGENYLDRYAVFATNLITTSYMNLLERGTAEYGVTPFMDLTPSEFASTYKLPKTMIKNHLKTKKRNFKQPNYTALTTGDDPEEFDWRQQNAVTEVKNQGMCGSCWSFSTTGNIEGVHAVATGDLISLSEQELVDCDKMDNGCQGGLMDNAFEEIERLGGLESEADYGYTGKAGKCSYDQDKVAVTINGFHDVPVGDELAMKHQLLETGPLAVALNAMWMQFYRGGVSHPWRRLCSPKMLDHGVLIVGYGVEPANPDHVPLPKKEQPYWIIKNSWSDKWGEHGYYRLYRGDGTCGIDQYVTTAEA